MNQIVQVKSLNRNVIQLEKHLVETVPRSNSNIVWNLNKCSGTNQLQKRTDQDLNY